MTVRLCFVSACGYFESSTAIDHHFRGSYQAGFVFARLCTSAPSPHTCAYAQLGFMYNHRTDVALGIGSFAVKAIILRTFWRHVRNGLKDNSRQNKHLKIKVAATVA